jgi:hypothetical protein
MSPTPEAGPAELILKDGRTFYELAAAAGINPSSICKAKATNEWPKHRRVRLGLRRALGIEPQDPNAPTFPILIRSVEECEAVLARLKASQTAPQPIADAIPRPA